MIEKDVVIPALIAEWQAIDELLASLSPEQWATPTALPNWDVHDNVAHVIGTECALSGQSPPRCDVDVRGLDHVHNDIGASNETWVIGLRGETPAAMLERYRDVIAVRRKHLESLSQEEFDAPSWTPTGPGTYGQFMRTRVFDCWMHEQDIREAVGVPGNEDGPCAELALSVVGDAMGFIVGKRAAAPQGATVTIELTGPVHRTWHLAVDGRASVVDELPGPATTTVRLPSTLFTRLTGGRRPTDDHIADADITGDADLGRRLVHALPFTI